ASTAAATRTQRVNALERRTAIREMRNPVGAIANRDPEGAQASCRHRDRPGSPMEGRAAAMGDGEPQAQTTSSVRYSVLLVSTLAFTICFAVWMMFGVIGIPIRQQLGLNNTQFGLLTSTPVLLGALMRLPLGIWTDR